MEPVDWQELQWRNRISTMSHDETMFIWTPSRKHFNYNTAVILCGMSKCYKKPIKYDISLPASVHEQGSRLTTLPCIATELTPFDFPTVLILEFAINHKWNVCLTPLWGSNLVSTPNSYSHYCQIWCIERAAHKNIRIKACSIGPTIGRANTEAKNGTFSCIAWPNECINIQHTVIQR